jgi:hypothetical protein
MKKWLIGTAITLVVVGSGGYFGYNYFMNMAANKLSQELTKDIQQDPQLSQELDKITSSQKAVAGSPGKESLASLPSQETKQNSTTLPAATQQQVDNQQSNTSTNNPSQGSSTAISQEQKSASVQFDSKQDAVKFAMSRFSLSEINEIRQLASGGLTPEKKAELKKIAYSKFSPEEINAVRKAVGR